MEPAGRLSPPAKLQWRSASLPRPRTAKMCCAIVAAEATLEPIANAGAGVNAGDIGVALTQEPVAYPEPECAPNLWLAPGEEPLEIAVEPLQKFMHFENIVDRNGLTDRIRFWFDIEPGADVLLA